QRQAVRHGRSFLQHVVPAVIKPLHSLWNEVIGFLFCSLGAFFGIRTYRSLRDAASSPVMTFMGGLCTLMLIGFGISSFLRARKISRS
ncbi:MAG TPA: hypothetical protein VGS58_20070, partial [Candidatus Sulfopaludibacter sp.]|nr:hypothetical protein [Candidatus Sulfopaludibacter sp.]